MQAHRRCGNVRSRLPHDLAQSPVRRWLHSQEIAMMQVVAHPAREETLESAGGLKIFVRSWRPDDQPRAVVVICHGVNSHGGQYMWAADQFANSGLRRVRARSARPREIGRASASTSRTSRITSATSRRSSSLRNRGIRACPCSCSVTAPAASSPRSTRSRTRPSSPGSSARASRSRCRRPALRLPPSRG